MRRQLGDVASPLFYRFVDARLRPGRRTALRSLVETQYWSIEELRELQGRLLRRLVEHAARVSPLYRDRLREAPDPERFALSDLRRLPILERSDLQDHLEELSDPARAEARENWTGGSTGEPVRLYQSREYGDWAAAAFERGFLTCKPFRLGMRRAFFWGSNIDSRAHRGLGGTVRDVVVNQLWFDALALRSDRLSETVRRLRDYRPMIVVGYVSTLTEVARALDRPLDGLAAVVTSAETLTATARALITSAFGAPVFDRYATRELGVVAHECEAHQGLHLEMENNIVEVIGADGQPLDDPGAEGEVLVTSLRNLATPLIRYRMSDIARLGASGCPCGRRSNRVESLLGRASDVIVSPHGVQLHPLFFDRLFDNTPVHRYRVDQETPDRLRVRVVPGAQYNDDVRQRVTSLILARGDASFDVVWEVVSDIPLTPAGKFRFTVSHVKRERPSA